MCLAAALMLLCFSSCKDVKPEFKFSPNLTGEVQNAPTAVAGDFAVNVANEQAVFFSLENAGEVLSIEAPQGNDANNWLDSYVEANVLSYFDSQTGYDIYVKGYVKESVTGLMLTVDKRFTNKTEN